MSDSPVTPIGADLVTMRELNPHGYTTTAEQYNNLVTLHDRINKVRTAYGKPMQVTSGLRTLEDQTRIDGGRPGIGGRPARVRTGSMHLKGAACDIWDRDRQLAKWVMENLKLMETIGLWIENPIRTSAWIHFQIYPPGSGNRVFEP